MRNTNRKLLLASVVLLSAAWLLDAAWCDDDVTTIRFPGMPHAGALRGDILLCANSVDQFIAVDLKRGKTFDLGKNRNRRWADADVADGQVLLIEHDRLQTIALENGKVVHDLPLGAERVFAFGFAGKGKAFVQRRRAVDILDLDTGKTLHGIKVDDKDDFWYSFSWQKVANRLFLPGAATSIYVIDLDAGKICDRLPIESRSGVAALHVEGSLIYCRGPQFSWVPNDHLTCFDMESKKTFFSQATGARRQSGRFASGPYGSVYSFLGDRIDRYTMVGEHCGSFTTPNKETVLAVWRQKAVMAATGEIRVMEIRETAVAKK
jgi:hypothetical protein